MATETKPKKLSLAEAQDYVAKNHFEIPKDLIRYPSIPPADFLRCIDDREHRKGEELPLIAIPGGGLGLVIAVFRAIHQLEEKKKRTFSLIEPQQIVDRIEHLIGIPHFHSDENHDGDILPCAGCGHCAGAINVNDLSAQSVAFLKDSYIPGLVKRGIRPTVYQGEHAASAVFIIKDFHTGLTPYSKGNGPRAYVLNKEWYKYIVSQMCDELFFDPFLEMAPDLTRVDLTRACRCRYRGNSADRMENRGSG